MCKGGEGVLNVTFNLAVRMKRLLFLSVGGRFFLTEGFFSMFAKRGCVVLRNRIGVSRILWFDESR